MDKDNSEQMQLSPPAASLPTLSTSNPIYDQEMIQVIPDSPLELFPSDSEMSLLVPENL